MTNPVFPTMDKEQDSKFYEVAQEDKALKTTMDGGYVVSRAKHTRKPRKTFKTGYTGISNADRKRLMDFFDQVDCSVIFDWPDPVEKVVYQVRMNGALSFKYTGMGVTQIWDVTLELEQA